jgi:hypothetical protein
LKVILSFSCAIENSNFLVANETLSARTEPILNDIFELLEPLANDGPSSIRPVAREARMVLTARLASTSASKSMTNDRDNVQEQYQKALKLLQDPILPVRAHGLLLLRQLVSPEYTKGSSTQKRAVNPALVPAILSIFMQSIRDEESYIFLNAVQGLAAMTDTVGREIVQGLIRDYSKDVESSGLSQQDTDMRLRIGEALSIVIKRCGSALPDYSMFDHGNKDIVNSNNFCSRLVGAPTPSSCSGFFSTHHPAHIGSFASGRL